MRMPSESSQNLLFFTFATCRAMGALATWSDMHPRPSRQPRACRLMRITHGLTHSPLHESGQQLVELDDRDHRPGHDHLAFVLAVSAIGGPRHPLGRDPAHRFRTNVAL